MDYIKTRPQFEKKKTQGVFSGIGIFILLLFSYTSSLTLYISKFAPFEIAVYCMVGTLLVFIYMLNILNIYYAPVLVILTFLIVYRNHSLANGTQLRCIQMLIAVYIMMVLQLTDTWFKYAKYAFILFSVIHLFTGWLFLIYPSYFVNYVVGNIGGNTDSLLNWNSQGMLLGLTTHYTTSGIYCAIACIFSFSFLYYGKNHKVLYIIFFVTSILSLLLTQKRGPIIATVATILLLYYIIEKLNLKSVCITVATIGGVIGATRLIAMTILPSLSGLFSRFSEMFSSTADTTNGRSQLYELAFKLFREHPLIGIGWDGFRYEYKKMLYSSGTYYELLDVHNIYLQLLCEVGLIGFILIIGFLLGALVKSILQVRELKKLNAPHLNYIMFATGIQLFTIIYGFTGNSIYDKQVLFPYAISVGMVLAVSYKKDKQRDVSDELV